MPWLRRDQNGRKEQDNTISDDVDLEAKTSRPISSNDKKQHSIYANPTTDPADGILPYDRKIPRKPIHELAIELLKHYWGLLAFLAFGVIALGLLGGLAYKPLSWQAWFTYGLVFVLFGVLMVELMNISVAFVLACVIFLALKIITPANSLLGFGNTGVATVATLYAVAEGINRTNGLLVLLRWLGGRPKHYWLAQLRLFAPLAIISAFVHNTPLVAMANPIVQTYCRQRSFPTQKFLIPLNAAVLLGGISTTIGTSTNLIVVGLVQSKNLLLRDGKTPVKLGFFALAPIGAVISSIGIIYILFTTRFLLNGRKKNGVASVIENPREYTTYVRVKDRAPFVGFTVTESGLRNIDGLQLVEVSRRDGEVIKDVTADTRLRAGDVLRFVGVIETVRELYLFQGLVPATRQSQKVPANANYRRLVEIVVSNHSYLVGQTPRQALFRSRYGAAIFAIYRAGGQIEGNIDDIELKAGDSLVVEATQDFVGMYGMDPNFALVSEVKKSQPKRDDLFHMVSALAIMVGMTVAASGGSGSWVALLTSSGVAAFLMIAFGCCTWRNAARAIDVPVMITIAASFGVGNALDVSGAASAFAGFILKVFRKGGHTGILFGIYIATAVITNIITNNAAATLMFPVVTSIIKQEKTLNIYSAIYTLMLSASASFSTPIGYQTNLMVHAPGYYSFADWFLFGFPLQILVMIPSVFMVRALWP